MSNYRSSLYEDVMRKLREASEESIKKQMKEHLLAVATPRLGADRVDALALAFAKPAWETTQQVRQSLGLMDPDVVGASLDRLDDGIWKQEYEGNFVASGQEVDMAYKDERALREKLMQSARDRQEEKLGPGALGKPAPKIYDASNVTVTIGGQAIDLAGNLDGFAAASVEEPRTTEISVELVVKNRSDGNGLDKMLELLRAGVVTKEQVAAQIAEASYVAPNLPAPRGSWFAFPSIPTEAQMARWDVGLRQMWQSRMRDLSGLNAERIKRPEFLWALDVVCRCCRHPIHYQIVQGWQSCTKCNADYWPEGVFDVAVIALQLSGDLTSFQQMLMYPPEDL